MEAFKSAGGSTIVDVGVPAIGRDPHSLAKLSQETGVHIVMGCGWYRESYHPVDLGDRPPEQLAEELVVELEYGVGDSGIRPGIIGEIGFEAEIPTPNEEKAMRAAALAHRKTGAAITTHTCVGRSGVEALKILKEESVPPDRIVIGHADCYPDKRCLLALLAEGCFVQFDCIAFYFLAERGIDVGWVMSKTAEEMADLTVDLIRSGYLKRILLSHDLCHKGLLKVSGGVGLTGLMDAFFPLLRERGVKDAELTEITARNPGRVLIANS